MKQKREMNRECNEDNSKGKEQETEGHSFDGSRGVETKRQGLCIPAGSVVSALKDLSPDAVDWSKAHIFFTGECLAHKTTFSVCWLFFSEKDQCFLNTFTAPLVLWFDCNGLLVDDAFLLALPKPEALGRKQVLHGRYGCILHEVRYPDTRLQRCYWHRPRDLGIRVCKDPS